MSRVESSASGKHLSIGWMWWRIGGGGGGKGGEGRWEMGWGGMTDAIKRSVFHLSFFLSLMWD